MTFFLAVLAVDEVVDHAALDRAGTVERVERGEVFQARGLVAAQDVAHAVRFKLEDGGGIAARKKLVGGRVVERQRVQVDVRRRDWPRPASRCRQARSAW